MAPAFLDEAEFLSVLCINWRSGQPASSGRFPPRSMPAFYLFLLQRSAFRVGSIGSATPRLPWATMDEAVPSAPQPWGLRAVQCEPNEGFFLSSYRPSRFARRLATRAKAAKSLSPSPWATASIRLSRSTLAKGSGTRPCSPAAITRRMSILSVENCPPPSPARGMVCAPTYRSYRIMGPAL